MEATGNQLTALQQGSQSGRHVRVVMLAAIALLLDGFDNQVFSLSLPVWSAAWGVPADRFAAPLALGLMSMSAGTILAGWLGDRRGPKKLLVLSVAIFGAATAATAWANGLGMLVPMRMLTCLGLGASVPNAIAIVTEFSSASRRAMLVTLLILCIPLGGGLASLVAAEILPVARWETLFLVAGILPLLLAIVLGFLLPESPAFLARPAARLRGAISVGNPSGASDSAAASRSHWKHLFSHRRRRDTLALWLALAASFSAVYSCYNWMPAVLTAAGFGIATASRSMVYLNVGGIAGGLTAAWLVTRFGSRVSMPALSLVGALAVVPLFLAAARPGFSGFLPVAMAMEGFLLNGVQSALFALVANAYEAGYRATGVGTVVGAARLSAIVVASAVAPLVSGDGTLIIYFAVLAALSGMCAGGITLVRRQIEGSSAPRPQPG